MIKNPTIALSAKWNAYPERFRWIVEHGFAVAYAPNPEDLGSLAEHVDYFLKAGVPVRYHGFLRGYEFGHQDAPRPSEVCKCTWRRLRRWRGVANR